MPKEHVIDRAAFNGDATRGLRCEVRWGRDDETVQIATVADEAPPSSGLGAEGWFVTLTRYDINALIRHLKRARDQAFGRDE